ncbi:MAG: gamma-glutamylcyclotransferase family protein [Candidatus Methanosuratincola petrocarbonis]
MPQKVFYFAYGSNMDQERLRDRIGSFHSRKHAILEGYDLVFNKRDSSCRGAGFANIVKGKGKVEGILYEIDETCLEKLDSIEGVHTNHYNRIEIKVECEGKLLNAWVYVANENKVEEGLKPKKEYLNHLLKGQDLLSKEYFKKLQEVKTID